MRLSCCNRSRPGASSASGRSPDEDVLTPNALSAGLLIMWCRQAERDAKLEWLNPAASQTRSPTAIGRKIRPWRDRRDVVR